MSDNPASAPPGGTHAAVVYSAVAIVWYVVLIRPRVNRGDAATAMKALGVE